MLSRVLSKPSTLRFITLISSSHSHYKHPNPPLIQNPTSFSTLFSLNTCYFSTNHGNNNNNHKNGVKTSDSWNISMDGEDIERSFFSIESKENDEEHDVLGVTESEGRVEGFNEWKIVGGDEKDGYEIFDSGDAALSELAGLDGNLHILDEKAETLKKEEDRKLEIEEKDLLEVLKGGDHAFGDLISASGITDEMLDSLMALKDLDGVPGLPPLNMIEDMRYEKNTHKLTRADIERQKQEEIAKSRVRQVDSQGRAYGTGKRKCSIARVWIEPGEGKFVINDKQFDVYFPMLDQRAALLRPLSETKTLGLLDVNCTVKGGGISGQIGAIRLGMSRALQNWAPDQFRPPLKEAGFLTRDSRIVERKKPGKAKARKSYQWVKR
ncbi:putative ribosomal protein S9 [Helianthus debilis subsp. tardiflorus]